MQKTNANPGGVGFGGGHALVILELAGQGGSRDVIEQRRCLGRNTRRRDGVVRKWNTGSVRIVNRDRSAFLSSKTRQIPLALSRGGHGAVLAEWRGRPLPGEVEEDHIFGVVLDHVGDVWGAHEGKPKLILRITGLWLPLGPDGEWSGIQCRVPTRPEECA